MKKLSTILISFIALTSAVSTDSLASVLFCTSSPERDIESPLTVDRVKKRGLRVLYWNIQNGMWYDQVNGYDNFVAWVRSWDPDVCVWCEASTIYYDNTYTAMPKADRYLPGAWNELAARYGHRYTAIGGFRDNYPQVITSRYPITTLRTITDTSDPLKPVSHGAGIHQISVGGQIVNVVTLHTWPQSFAFGTPEADRPASSAIHGGEAYRKYEMEQILSMSVNDEQFSGQEDWLVMGDFNSRSRIDNWYYGYPEDSHLFWVHDVVAERTDLVDVIGTRFKGEFISSTFKDWRYDYMYASPSMYARIVEARTIVDDWTSISTSPHVPSFKEPSDHRPIMADFVW